jgi:phosphoglycolate phosphatase-like HAD superfamily hydrolase
MGWGVGSASYARIVTDLHAPLVVGFDLDMTLIDTVPGFAATLVALGEEIGVEFPVDDITNRLGPPLEMLFADHLPAELIDGAGERFRELYPDYAIAPVTYLPGAKAALAAVRRHRGRIVVVTGKFPRNAQLHVDHLEMDIDVLEGWVWGIGKAEVLKREGALMYVGDHIHDVEGALAANALSVSVTTGGCTAQELSDAGSHVVLRDLTEFEGWFESHRLGAEAQITN